MKFIIKLNAKVNKLPVILILLLLAVLSFSALTIQKKVVQKMKDQLISIIHDLSDQQNNIVSNKVDDWYRFATTLAELSKDDNGLNKDKITELVKSVNKSVERYVLIVDENGIGLGFQEKFNVSDRRYFKTIKEGKKTISELLQLRESGQNVVVVAVPIKLGDKVIGGVICSYVARDLERLFQNKTLNSFGSTLILQNDGTILIGNNNFETSKSFYKYESIRKMMGYDNLQLFREKIRNKKSGYFKYEHNGKIKYLYFTYNKITGWFVVSLIDEVALESYTKNMTNGAMSYIYIILVCITILFIFILLLYIIIIRLLKRNSDELLVEKERFQMITEQSEDVIFDYNIDTKVLYFSTNFKDEFGIDPPELIDEVQNLIAPDDVMLFFNKVQELLDGNPKIKFELKLKNAKNNFDWYQLSASLLFDTVQYHRLIGRLQNINEYKQKMNHLSNLAEVDPLTKLLNKEGTIQHINTYLHGKGKSSKHAYFFIDIDNFKSVNDTFGHQEGDLLLTLIAGILKKQFDSKDIIGRFGGDEFIILMKNYSSVESVSCNAHQLCKKLLDESSKKKYHFSASIGIALYPKNGTKQRDLMKNADDALYEAKKLGKNQYQFYEDFKQ